MQMAGETFEVAQHLEAGDPQPARAHRRDRRRLAVRMTRDVGRVQHDLREARLAHRAQLRLERPRERDHIHAEVIEIHSRNKTAWSDKRSSIQSSGTDACAPTCTNRNPACSKKPRLRGLVRILAILTPLSRRSVRRISSSRAPTPRPRHERATKPHASAPTSGLSVTYCPPAAMMPTTGEEITRYRHGS